MVTRIGVNATTSVQAGRTNPGTPSGRFQIAGVTASGPTGSTVVRSLAQYVQAYGGRTAYAGHMYDAANLFFQEGGAELVVTRVVGPSATGDTASLPDRASTPVPTLQVTATWPGTTGLSVVVSDADGGTYGLAITGEGGAVLASWTGLTTVQDAVAAAVGHPLVRVTSLGASTTGAQALPKAGTYPLSGGSDDRAAVTMAVIGAALTAGGLEATGGAVAVPGYPADVVAPVLVPVAKAHRQVALLSLASTETAQSAASKTAALVGMEDGDHAGVFYPWMVVPDGTRRRLVDPVGYVAAVRSRAHLTTGYWRVPAGEASRVEYAVETAPAVDVATNDTLAGSRLNGITTIYGVPRLYGWQSLSADAENLGLLSARDTLNSLTLAVERVLEPYIFATIDGRGYLQSSVEADVSGVLAPVADAGGLFARVTPSGDQLDPGYRVTVDHTINTLETLTRNELHVLVAVRLSPTAQLIHAEIVKVALAAAV